jgi:hypothetical protein
MWGHHVALLTGRVQRTASGAPGCPYFLSLGPARFTSNKREPGRSSLRPTLRATPFRGGKSRACVKTEYRLPNKDVCRRSLNPSPGVVPGHSGVEPAVRCPDKLHPACRLTSASSDRTTEDSEGSRLRHTTRARGAPIPGLFLSQILMNSLPLYSNRDIKRNRQKS